jgi:hypothetical protein
MSLILTWTSSSASSLAPTTSSAIALSNTLIGASIAVGALIFLLVFDYVMSQDDSWNAHTAAILRAFYLPLIVTFCAFVVFNTALVL